MSIPVPPGPAMHRGAPPPDGIILTAEFKLDDRTIRSLILLATPERLRETAEERIERAEKLLAWVEGGS